MSDGSSKRAAPSTARPSLAAALEKYDRNALISLLAHYEAELQAQELALSILKAQNIGKLFDYDRRVTTADANMTADAELALLRDGSFELSGDSAGQRRNITAAKAPPLSRTLHQTHVEQLEKMAAAQRSFSRKAKQTMNALEKRHAKILHEMHLEKERAQNNSLKSDEFFLLVENERNKVQGHLDQKDEEIAALEAQLDAGAKALKTEKERERIMILYLFNERKQLLLRLNEMRLRLNTKNDLEDSPVVSELRKQLSGVSGERDSLAGTVRTLQSEKEILQRKVRHLEENLLLIQQNVLYRTREQTETLERNTRMDGLILANRGAFASENRHQPPQSQPAPPLHHNTHPASHHQRQTSQPSSSSSSSVSQYTPQVSASKSAAAPMRGSKAPLALPQVSGSVTPATSTTTGIDSHAYSSGKTASSLTNGIPPSTHSTVLLHRSSGRPPLGIKASNLPLSRNSAAGHAGALPTPVAYRPSTTGKLINSLPKSVSNNGGVRRPFSSTHLRTSTSFPTSLTSQPQSQLQPSSLSSSTTTTVSYQRHGPFTEAPPFLDNASKDSATLTKRSSSLPRTIVQSAQQLNLLQNARNIIHRPNH